MGDDQSDPDNDDSDDDGKNRILLTINRETLDWLDEQYPEADSAPEAVRSAIGDARRLWKMVNGK